MSESDDGRAYVSGPGPMPPIPPPRGPLATLYAEFVPNLAVGVDNQTVAFYLIRSDPAVSTGDGGKDARALTVVAQIVMPMSGWINTAIFFQKRLEQLVQLGLMPQEHLDKLRADFEIGLAVPDDGKPGT